MPPPSDLRARAGLDVRLVPAAVLAWATAVAVIMRPEWAIVVVPSSIATAVALPWAWQRWSWRWGRGAVTSGWRAIATIVVPAVAVASVAVATRIRIAQARAHELYEDIGGMAKVQLRLVTEPKATEFGASAKARIEGLPGQVTAFGDESLLAITRDTVIESTAGIRVASKPCISGIQLNLRGDVEVIAPPQGLAADVRQQLFDSAQNLPVGPDRLIPAMAIGDERGFSLTDGDVMTASGLSHLSAVSGANVALVVGAVVAVFSWAGPRVRVAVAALALYGFVAIVGTEPSVLRAVVTGCIGLLAILVGRAGQAIAALSAGIIGLILLAPDLSVSVGFALSVAATAGLVLLAEPLARRLSATTVMGTWPAPVVRAVAVSIAAHVVTMPVLALLIGEISHVSLLANLLAAPAVAPVTIAGSLAAVAAALHLNWLVSALLWCAAPCAWWIHQVARLAAGIVAPATGTVTLVISCTLTFACLTALWAWPRLALRAGAFAAVLAAGSYAVIWVFGLDIARAPQGWKLAACAEKNQIVLIHAGTAGEPANHVASVGYPAPTPLSRQCRIALGLTEQMTWHTQVLDTAADNTTTETVVVESPSYIAEAVSGQPLQSHRSPQWFIARECGPRVRETVMTPEHIPVVCPQRDGPQALYSNGEVWRGR
ncbi:ComEC/Rec2 family competence protein [Corynebacterium amycolatum]|uniref:ComEC/Rec2 family competence protein n=1 Tax=Corynebacterium amycolatum TaxID=43765 RepID=UPI000C7764B0|nr:ComEC/Rec2 family competence protein [Corynebacterium amycolatum]PLA35542.1 competence protein [Corynebacterium amycolatum]